MFLFLINYFIFQNPKNELLFSSFMDTSCISEVNTSQSDHVETVVEVKCGVCSELCLNRDWIMHIQSKHDYLAWKEGEPPLVSVFVL